MDNGSRTKFQQPAFLDLVERNFPIGSEIMGQELVLDAIASNLELAFELSFIESALRIQDIREHMEQQSQRTEKSLR